MALATPAADTPEDGAPPTPSPPSYFKTDAPKDSGYENYEYTQGDGGWQKTGLSQGGVKAERLGMATPEEVAGFLKDARPTATSKGGAITVAAAGDDPFAALKAKYGAEPTSAPPKAGADTANDPFADLKTKYPEPGVVDRAAAIVKKAPEAARAALPRGSRFLNNKTEDDVKAAVRKARGLEPDIDYDTGASFNAMYAIERSDNPGEAKKALQRMYGQGNAGQDPGGRWWVKEGDRKISVFPTGLGGSFERFGVGSLATAPGTVGAIGGGLAGTPLGPAGMLGGAAAGYVGGKGLDEIVKAMQGDFEKTPSQEAETLASGAALNTAFQGAGPALKQTLGGVMPALRRGVFGATEEGAAQAQKLLARGARPPLASAVPHGKAFQYDQMLRNLVSGNPQEKRNVDYIQRELREIFRTEGFDEAATDSILAEINDRTTAISAQPVGEMLVGRVTEHAAQLKAAADAAEREAENAVGAEKTRLTQQANAARDLASKAVEGEQRRLKGEVDKMAAQARAQVTALGHEFDALAKQQAGPLAADVAAQIQAKRREFSTAMTKLYDAVDEMTGGESVISTDLFKAVTKPMLELLPESQTPRLIREIDAMPNLITIKDAQRLRTRLRELESSRNLTPDVTNHDYGELADAVDASFSAATLGNAPQAVKALRETDAIYKAGIAKYRDAMINKLVRDMRAGLPVDAETVVSTITREGHTARTQTILGLLDTGTKQRVAAIDTRNMLANAAKMGDSGLQEVRGAALVKILDDRKAVLPGIYDDVYGRDFIPRLRRYATELAAVDGKVDLSALQPGQVQDSLRSGLRLAAQLGEVDRQQLIAAATSGDPLVLQRALAGLSAPAAVKTELANAFQATQDLNALSKADLLGAMRSGDQSRMAAAISNLSSPAAVEAQLKQGLTAIRVADEFVNSNFMGALASKDPAVVDRAYHAIVQPGGEERLHVALDFFGADSAEVKAIREYWLKTTLSRAVIEMPSRAMTITGTAIDRELAKYTRRQLEMLAPDGLAEDLRMIANDARFLFPWETGEGGKDMGGSLAAAQIKGNLPGIRAILRYVHVKVMGFIADRPTTIRILATGLRGPTEVQKTTRAIMGKIGQAALNESLAGPGAGR